jgi:calpain-15
MVKFTDDSFPANESSLYNDLTRKPSDWLVTHNKSIKWLRPADIKVEKEERLRWSVFNNTKASDIQQGYIGDCWLLSPLSVLAENPTFLHRTIVNKVSNDGYYQVRLCHNGEWKSVEIDDFFPCNFNNSLLFSKAIRKQLWVPLIEKALAKLNGCYENLIGGTNSEGK